MLLTSNFSNQATLWFVAIFVASLIVVGLFLYLLEPAFVKNDANEFQWMNWFGWTLLIAFPTSSAIAFFATVASVQAAIEKELY